MYNCQSAIRKEVAMLIDLWSLLSYEGKEMKLQADIDMESFNTGLNSYRLIEKKPVSLSFTHTGNRHILVEADIDVVLSIPCDRCLEEVKTNISLKASKEVDLNEDSENDDVFDTIFMDGTVFDSEKFVYGEILVNLPMKVLCSEDCKGICNRCGTNLNHGSCGCDTTELDPRMAKVLEVFNSFKEG